MKPVLIEEGHHARDLRARTGLDVQENQARRLLSDIDQFRAWLERQEDRSIPRAVATARWLAEVYQPIIDTIPDELRSRLEPAEVFHQLLEHRYLMAERRGEDVTNEDSDGRLPRQRAGRVAEGTPAATRHRQHPTRSRSDAARQDAAESGTFEA